MKIGPFMRAWRAYKRQRWNGYEVDPDFYRTVRKAFKAGFRAAEREAIVRARPRCILPAMTITELAEKAYAAYGAVTDHKNYQGLPMPAWADLPPKIQEAWRAATSATVTHCVNSHMMGEQPLEPPTVNDIAESLRNAGFFEKAPIE